MFEYGEKQLQYLILHDLLGDLTAKEERLLKNWINESEEHRLLFSKIKKEWQINEARDFLHIDPENAWKRVRNKTFANPVSRSVKSWKWLRYAAVFIPIMLSATALWVWISKEEAQEKAIQEPKVQLYPVLILENGKAYQLDLDAQTEIRLNAKEKAYQVNGELVYSTNGKHVEDTYNSIQVPRGTEYRVTLSDGTQVWMNAASELRYPVTFSSEERRIYLKGEAYFQVKSDKKRPFYVETDNLCIRVLGTEFNVNTHYSKGVRTVLVGGTIVLQRKNQQEIQMTPGELADFDQKTSEIMVQKVDITPYISWKKGFFVFEEENLEEIMNSLALWYDKEFYFLNPKLKNLHFSGHLKRYDRIETILSAITEVTGVDFQINGQTILIR